MQISEDVVINRFGKRMRNPGIEIDLTLEFETVIISYEVIMHLVCNMCKYCAK